MVLLIFTIYSYASFGVRNSRANSETGRLNEKIELIKDIKDNPGQEWKNWCNLWQDDEMTWDRLGQYWQPVEESWAHKGLSGINWEYIDKNTYKGSRITQEMVLDSLNSLRSDYEKQLLDVDNPYGPLVLAIFLSIILIAAIIIQIKFAWGFGCLISYKKLKVEMKKAYQEECEFSNDIKARLDEYEKNDVPRLKEIEKELSKIARQLEEEYALYVDEENKGNEYWKESIYEQRQELSDEKFKVASLNKNYSSSEILSIKSIIKAGRADSLKEAINIFIQEKQDNEYREAMLAEAKTQNYLLEQEAKQAEKHRYQMEKEASLTARKMQDEARRHNQEMEQQAQLQSKTAQQQYNLNKQNSKSNWSSRCSSCKNYNACNMRGFTGHCVFSIK